MKLLVSDLFAERYGGRIQALAPGAEFVQLRGDKTFSGPIDDVEVVATSTDMFQRDIYGPLIRALPALGALKWFSASWVGMDYPGFRDLAERGVIVTNSPGVSAVPIAQYVLAMMLRQVKNLAAWDANQRAARWQRVDSDELTGKTVTIVGVGAIGCEVARLCQAFGMRVLGVRRRQDPVPAVDQLYPPARLHDALAAADFVVLACPLTDETRGLIDAAALAAMLPTAYLINVARGQVVVEPDLIAALEGRRIAGAALDVFEHEPLPAGSPLWALPNVVVTPHASSHSPGTLDRAATMFLENLRRFSAGEPLRHVVDFRDGMQQE
jgi:phosphoglycerate dehydrogenase-like enzyme